MVRPLAGFPDAWGNKRVSVMRVNGPASYAQYTAPTTGGQDIAVAPTSGVKFADFAIGAISDAGTHRAEVVRIEAASVGGLTVPGSRLVLKWYLLSTGAEIGAGVNLSAQIVSILVIGPN